jgi:hydroxypyruvate isomerase
VVWRFELRLTCSTRCFPEENRTLSLARIQWAGFKAAEVAMDPGDSDAADGNTLRAALEQCELELSAIEAGELMFDSEEAALRSVTHLGRCALLAHQLDGPRVVFRAASGTAATLAFGLQHLLATMRGYSVEFCPVNDTRSVLQTPEDMETLQTTLARLVPADRLGLALDPAAADATGWDAEEFASAAELPLRYVYFTDAIQGRPVLPGSGEVDWPAFIAALRADGYEGYLSIVLPGNDPLTAESDAKEARGYAEALIYSAD